MTEPMQTTIDGEEVPYRQFLTPTPREDLEVHFSFTATDDFSLQACDAEPDGESRTAKEFVESFIAEFRSIEKMMREWDVEPRHTLIVSVYDPVTKLTTTATWND